MAANTPSLDDAQSAARARRDLAIHKQHFIWRDVKSRRLLRATQSTGNALSGFSDALRGVAVSLNGMSRTVTAEWREQADKQYEIARLSSIAGYNVTADLDRYANEFGMGWRDAVMFASQNILAGLTIDGKRSTFS